MSLMLEPDATRRLIQGMRGLSENWSGNGELVLLVPPLARGPIRRLFEKALPRVPVLSPGEIVPGTPLQRAGELALFERGQKPLKNGPA
jgi:flagellar biosynthesis component FlhA